MPLRLVLSLVDEFGLWALLSADLSKKWLYFSLKFALPSLYLRFTFATPSLLLRYFYYMLTEEKEWCRSLSVAVKEMGDSFKQTVVLYVVIFHEMERTTVRTSACAKSTPEARNGRT